MKDTFPLFQSHLDVAHTYWKKIITEGDTAIDATCGNGHDTLELASHSSVKRVISLDFQKEAIEKSQLIVKNEKVEFFHQCHSSFPSFLAPQSVKLIVYNLGYLPGGDKSITTEVKTTLQSINQAQSLIQQGGAISITCYPGHQEGAKEEEAILEMISEWDPKVWSCCHHRWLNRKNAPSLLFIQTVTLGKSDK